jgi:hypothetical protein
VNLEFSLKAKSHYVGQLPVIGLVSASLFVAVAILIGGNAAKAINGIGGLLWIGSAIALVRSLTGERRFVIMLGTVSFETLILVLLLKPSNLAWSVLGFALGGAAIALLTSNRPYDWALLLPALWLPVHLLVAISRAIVRAIGDGDAAVRSDPPPTAALVPFAMVVSALAGAWIIGWWRRRNLGRSKLAD